MSRVGRLGGALLAETEGAFYLVGNLKRPCDFAAAGFEPPTEEIDALARPAVRLLRAGALAVPGPWLTLELESEALLQTLVQRLLIVRNGSVSDRLWRLILSDDPDDDVSPEAVVEARWLGEIPAHVWDVVRDNVLRCV